ncbi:DciA family protein (plasmid) [Streptomyces sp. NBC_01520]|uniref:DciA family protein n=1 Tax=Streptomyces sp. NBC_01520 TaxID=2903892 RepID=UPI002F91180C
MSDTSLSGVDLARVALQTARAAAKSAPRTQRTKTTTTARPRKGGRDPLPFGEAVAQMVAARGWDTTTASAARSNGVLEQWPAIAPELVGKVDAVRFDDATRTLHLLPATSAYRTQLTLHQKEIVAKVNAAVGQDTVRHLEILRPASLTAVRSAHGLASTERTQAIPVSSPSTPASGSKAPKPKTCETASQGYRRALEAHQASRKRTVVDPAIQSAIERQIREQAREPEALFDGRQALAELQARTTGQQQVRASDAARARALQKLAAERAGLPTITPAATPRVQHVVQVITDAEAS